jgi:hypothetical protein
MTEDWTGVAAVSAVLSSFPARLSPLRRNKVARGARRTEIELALDSIRRGLIALGPVGPNEPTEAEFSELAEDGWAFAQAMGDLRSITLERIQAFCQGVHAHYDQVYLARGMSLTGVVLSFLRGLLGTAAGDLIAEAPYQGHPDPELLRDLALTWLEENAARLRDWDQAGCLRLMVVRVGVSLVPLASRLYRRAVPGSRVRRAVEEIFTVEILEEIRRLEAQG